MSRVTTSQIIKFNALRRLDSHASLTLGGCRHRRTAAVLVIMQNDKVYHCSAHMPACLAAAWLDGGA